MPIHIKIDCETKKKIEKKKCMLVHGITSNKMLVNWYSFPYKKWDHFKETTEILTSENSCMGNVNGSFDNDWESKLNKQYAAIASFCQHLHITSVTQVQKQWNGTFFFQTYHGWRNGQNKEHLHFIEQVSFSVPAMKWLYIRKYVKSSVSTHVFDENLYVKNKEHQSLTYTKNLRKVH